MLPRKHRLIHKEIIQLKKGARRISSDHLTLVYKVNTVDNISKISCVVSKKTEKTAVKRNKIKRQCRELVKENMTSIPKKINGILSVNKVENHFFFQVLDKEIKDLFSKVE